MPHLHSIARQKPTEVVTSDQYYGLVPFFLQIFALTTGSGKSVLGGREIFRGGICRGKYPTVAMDAAAPCSQFERRECVVEKLGKSFHCMKLVKSSINAAGEIKL